MVSQNRTVDDGRRQQPLALILLQMTSFKSGDGWEIRCTACGETGTPLMRTEYMELVADAYEAGWRVLPMTTTMGRIMSPCCKKHTDALMSIMRTQAELIDVAMVHYAVERKDGD